VDVSTKWPTGSIEFDFISQVRPEFRQAGQNGVFWSFCSKMKGWVQDSSLLVFLDMQTGCNEAIGTEFTERTMR